MNHPITPQVDIRGCVRAMFASRPTLRQVVDLQLVKLIRARYPSIVRRLPQLTSAEALLLLAPNAPARPLVDIVLQAMLDGRPLDFSSVDGGGYSFKAGLAEEVVLEPKVLAASLNQLLPLLPEHFYQAQIAFWNGRGEDIDRDLWLQQMLRASLFDGMRAANLEPNARACLQDVLLGRLTGITVQAVRVHLYAGPTKYSEILPDLLITASDEVNRMILACTPAGEIRRFESLDQWAAALQRLMGQRFVFDSMSWDLFAGDGDAFALQSALLLESLLADVARLRRSRIATVAQLEQLYAQASEPARFFASFASEARAMPPLRFPSKLTMAEQQVRTAFAQGLIDLTVLQSMFKPGDDQLLVEDLHDYTSRRLREEMLADHPVDANYFSDDLLLTIDTFANDLHDLGIGQKIESKTITLTELAIARLTATNDGVITHIGHRENQLIMGWMNTRYVRELVSRIDIGRTYPLHVKGLLDDETLRGQRIATFAGHWRLTLLFDALRARVVNQLDQASYHALGRFCRQGADDGAEVRIAPLAFKRSLTSHQVECVHGMYVIELRDVPALLLYCPLLPNSLYQFEDAEALLAAIREPGRLQHAVLVWLDQSMRSIYDNGGFEEPHLPNLSLDPFNPSEKPGPAVLQLDYWGEALDTCLFNARQSLLLEIADRSAVSNSQERWGLIGKFAWSLFHVVTPVLPGPLATVIWLYAGIEQVISDVQVLSEGGEQALEAIIDVLSSSLMALVQLQVPTVSPVAGKGPSLQPWLDALPGADSPGVRPLPAPASGAIASLNELQAKADTVLDFSWRGVGGINGLSPSQRGRLRQLSAKVSLAGLVPVHSSRGAKLYQQGERFYAELEGDVYEVGIEEEDVRIIDRDRNAGPALVGEHGVWRVKTGLFGGSGRGARERLSRKLEQHVTGPLKALQRHIEAIKQREAGYETLSSELNELHASLRKLQPLLEQEPPLQAVERERFDKLQTLYREKQAQLEERILSKRRERLELVKQLESDHLGAEQALVSLRDNPNYIPTPSRAKRERETLVGLRQNLIAYEMIIIDETVSLGSFGQFGPAMDAYEAAPQPQKAALLARARGLLEVAVKDLPTMIDASMTLDRLIALSDGQLQIPYVGSRIALDELIPKRQRSTVALCYIQAMHLAELGLQMHKVSNEQFLGFRAAVAGKRLRLAASTHDLSFYLDLPVAQRIELLQAAWDEYLAAWLNVERLKGLSKQVVAVDWLLAYQRQVQQLKTLAGDALVTAMREQTSGQILVPARALHARKALQVAYTRDGQIVIGVEKTVEGQAQLQVHDPLGSEILHRFYREHGVWVEQVSVEEVQPQDVLPESDAATLVIAQELLQGNGKVIERAESMADEDADDGALTDTLSGQISDLEHFARLLDAHSERVGLVNELRDGAEALRRKRVELLQKLYTRTAYPSARGLRFLHEQALITVEYVGPRQQDSNGYLDEYKINLKGKPGSKGRPLWAAHFHFSDAQAAPTDFEKGHLKLWRQRLQGYKDQMMAAQSGEVLRIYRGNLTLGQASGIIPFHGLG